MVGYSCRSAGYHLAKNWRTCDFASNGDTDSPSKNKPVISEDCTIPMQCHHSHVSDLAQDSSHTADILGMTIVQIPGRFPATLINFTSTTVGEVAHAHIVATILHQLEQAVPPQIATNTRLKQYENIFSISSINWSADTDVFVPSLASPRNNIMTQKINYDTEMSQTGSRRTEC